MTVIDRILGRSSRHSEDGLWRAVVDALVDGVVSIDTGGIIRYANRATERLLGYGAAELVGRNVSILCPPPLDAEHDRFLGNYLRTGEAKVIGIGRETECRRKDGAIIPVHLSVSEVRVDGERMFVGVLHDLSSHKRVEAQLKSSEEFNRSIVNNAVDAVITIDTRGIVHAFNPSAESMFRCQAADIIGKSVNALVPEPFRSEHDRYLSDYLRTGRAKIIGIGREATAQRMDGTSFPMEIAVSEFKSADRHLFTATIKDITDRKQAEHRMAAEAGEHRVKVILDEVMQAVSDYADVIERVAMGDLLERVNVSGDDLLMSLGANLNVMLSSFLEVIRSMKGAIGSIAGAVTELEANTSAQSASAAEQAASVTETTSALEEIRAVSRQTLEKATGLGDIAERTIEASERGQHSIGDIVSGMGHIRDKVQNIADTILALSEQTQQIGEITDMVSRLAQESKMLALNASIEAAKAGEAGVGFAVVATEVKALAEQSEQATAQVRKILREIQHATDRAVMTTEEGTKEVEHGISLVEHTSEAFGHLAEAVESTALNSRQIIAAVRQENAGIDQIASAMGEINKVTGQAVSIAQRTKQAAADLARVAQLLEDKVRFYKV